MRSHSEIVSEIDRLQKEIGQLDTARLAFESQTIEQQLAWEMHKRQCHINHTDGCGWYYSKINDWSGSEKKYYLAKATSLLSILDGNVEKARKVVAIL